jgi:hypothetical protein
MFYQSQGRTPFEARNGSWMPTSIFREVEDNAIEPRTNLMVLLIAMKYFLFYEIKVKSENHRLDVRWGVSGLGTD